MVSVLQKVLGDPNEKAIKKLAPIVKEMNALEPEYQKLTDEELRAKTEEFRSRLAGEEDLDDIIPETFAAAREAARRNLKQRHYDVQLMGGMVLHNGQIAEILVMRSVVPGQTPVHMMQSYPLGWNLINRSLLWKKRWMPPLMTVICGPMYGTFWRRATRGEELVGESMARATEGKLPASEIF